MLCRRVIVDPELDQVVQREIAEIRQLHHGRRLAADVGRGFQGLEHGRAHPVGAVVVAGAKTDLQGHGIAPAP